MVDYFVITTERWYRRHRGQKKVLLIQSISHLFFFFSFFVSDDVRTTFSILFSFNVRVLYTSLVHFILSWHYFFRLAWWLPVCIFMPIDIFLVSIVLFFGRHVYIHENMFWLPSFKIIPENKNWPSIDGIFKTNKIQFFSAFVISNHIAPSHNHVSNFTTLH